MATKSFEELNTGALTIKNNELPESNTHTLVGGQLVDMVAKEQEIDDKVNDLATGEGSNIDILKFNPETVAQLEQIGQVRYNPATQCLEVKLNDEVTLSVGLDNFMRGKNADSIDLEAPMVVFVSGGLGSNALLTRASNDAVLGEKVIGVITQGIAKNNIGFVTTSGIVNSIDTSAYAEGDVLWLGTNGTLTNVKPDVSVNQICIGVVLRSHATEGSLLVAIKDDWRGQVAQLRSDLSQKLTELVPKSDVVQELGDSETAVMSQKAVTDEIAQLADDVIQKSLGKNIYNPKNTVEGYYINSTGTLVASAGVKIISIYSQTGPLVINYNCPVKYMYAGFYDITGNLISTINAQTNPLTLPAGTFRTDISVYPTAPVNLQVEVGTVSTDFEKYTEFKDILPDVILPDNIVTNNKIMNGTIEKIKTAFSRSFFVSGDEDLNVGLSDKSGNSNIFYSYGVRYRPTSDIVVNALKINNLTEECIVRIWSLGNSLGSIVYRELCSRKVLASEISTGYFLFPEMTFKANFFYDVSIERTDESVALNCSLSSATENPTHIYDFWFKRTSADVIGGYVSKVSAFSLVHIDNLVQDVRLTLKANEIIDFEAAVLVAANINKNEIAVPSQLYAYAGVRNDFNASQLIKYHNRPDNYLRMLGTGLKQYGEKAVFTPTVDISVTFELNDENCEVVESVVAPVRVAQSSDMTTPAIVCNIGDSLTGAGYWIKKAKDLLTTNAIFAGVRQDNLFPEIFHEGRSGWRLADYFKMKKSATEVYSPFMHPTAGTGIFQGVVESNAYMISTVGYMKSALDRIGYELSGYPTTPTTDSIVYSIANERYEKWDGTTWVDADMVDGDFSFNFSKYIQAWDIETEFGIINTLYIMLGTNDFIALNPANVPANFSAYKVKLDAVIASAKAYNASIKIGIGLENIYVGSDYNNEGAFASKRHLALYEERKLKLANYDNRIAENIYCVDWGIGLDREWGFEHRTIEAYPYCRSTSLITVDHNTPHPLAGDYAGYYPLAHSYAGWIAHISK